jgi:hypothetical protein
LVAFFVGAYGVLFPGAARHVLVDRARQPLAGFRLEFVQRKEPFHVPSSFSQDRFVNTLVFHEFAPPAVDRKLRLKLLSPKPIMIEIAAATPAIAREL